MIRVLIIALALIGFSTIAKAQDADLSILGNLVSEYFKAASVSDLNLRESALSNLFDKQGTMDAVILRQGQSSTLTEGTWGEFVEKSQGFYNSYQVEFEESEREVEYYLDMANVHCLVFQNSKEKASGSIYYQKLWMQFDVIFKSERWFIDHVIWINESDPYPIQNALLQDTIWHQTAE